MKKRGPLLASVLHYRFGITLIICVNGKSIRSGISVCFILICTISIVRFYRADDGKNSKREAVRSIRGTSGWERILYPCMRTTLPAR